MAFYWVLLVLLNRKVPPEFAKLKGWRVPTVVYCAAVFIFFALYLIYEMITLGQSSLTWRTCSSSSGSS